MTDFIFWFQLAGSMILGLVSLGLIIYFGIKRYNAKGREGFKERDF